MGHTVLNSCTNLIITDQNILVEQIFARYILRGELKGKCCSFLGTKTNASTIQAIAYEKINFFTLNNVYNKKLKNLISYLRS